jgi:hypothetical protein
MYMNHKSSLTLLMYRGFLLTVAMVILSVAAFAQEEKETVTPATTTTTSEEATPATPALPQEATPATTTTPQETTPTPATTSQEAAPATTTQEAKPATSATQEDSAATTTTTKQRSGRAGKDEGTVKGKVTAATSDEPVAGATVLLIPRGCVCAICKSDCDCCPGKAEVVTDKEGRFAIEVEAGTYTVRTLYGNVSKDEMGAIEVMEDKTRKVEVDLGVAAERAGGPLR